MAYHRPLDAYEEYIAAKHEREAQTLETTLEITRAKRSGGRWAEVPGAPIAWGVFTLLALVCMVIPYVGWIPGLLFHALAYQFTNAPDVIDWSRKPILVTVQPPQTA